MKRQIRGTFLALAAALVLGACASTVPATQISSRDIGEFLSGYSRVVSNSQELFCDKEKEDHFLRDVCYTRAQMKERVLADVRGNPVPALGLDTPTGWNGQTSSGYTSFNASGH